MAYTKRKRKCKNCSDYFLPDRRNIKKQKYCGKPECRKASKAASQRRWLAQKENKTYFRSPENVLRVQAWRALHPKYWQNRSKLTNALQDHSPEKALSKRHITSELAIDTLQDDLKAQHAVLIGLISHLTGNTLQDDIAETTRYMQQLGDDVLNPSTLTMSGGSYVNKKPYSPGSAP